MVVVIPAYEPDEKLLSVVAALKRDTDYAIVVVDDGSSETAQGVFAALPEDVVLLRHAQNRGKGRALKTAYEYILEHCYIKCPFHPRMREYILFPNLVLLPNLK